MDSMHRIAYLAILLTLFLTLIPAICALPVYDDVDRIVFSPIDSYSGLDDDYYLTYPQQYQVRRRQPVRRIDDTSLSKLSNGYYYVDNGAVTPVRPSGQRRQDFVADNTLADNDSLPSNVKFTPLVRYKQTKTNRKKLFVPNFFG